jgi:general secretion pathway protein L
VRQRLLATAEGMRRFLRWWSAELVACAQEAIAWVAPQWQRAVTIYVDANRLAIIDGDYKEQTPLMEFPRQHLRSELPDTLPDPVRAALERGRRVRVIVGARHAFFRRLRLPLVALPHLKTAVSLQLPKLLPLNATLLFTDFEVTLADPRRRIVDVDLAAIKRADVEPISRAIQAWGLRFTSLHLADGIDGAPRFRFTGFGPSGGAPAFGRVDRWMVGAAATLGLACAAVAVTQSYRAERTLIQAQGDTRAAASVALGRRQSLLARVEPLKTLSQLENAPSAAAILADITALVPPDSWVTTFELKQRTLRLVGVSPDAAALVRRLTSSALLADVELRSSMSVGIGTGRDRFEISAQAKSASP